MTMTTRLDYLLAMEGDLGSLSLVDATRALIAVATLAERQQAATAVVGKELGFVAVTMVVAVGAYVVVDFDVGLDAAAVAGS